MTGDAHAGWAALVPAFRGLLAQARSGAADWFAVADAVGGHLVPERCDWAMVHVRAPVLASVRAGRTGRLADLVGPPVAGELLALIGLRHRTGAGEARLRDHLDRFPPYVGDPYGIGRAALTGRLRHTPRVTDEHLRAAASSPRTWTGSARCA